MNVAEFSMPLLLVLLTVGLVILIKGADWLVVGAVALAERLGMSPLVIGLTIVAMGTSAPEVAASIAASLADSGDIAVGNVYGSNIANLALVGGICALIRPIGIHSAALWRDIPLMIFSGLLLKLLMLNNFLGRPSAFILILVFLGIMFFMIRTGRKKPELAVDFIDEKELEEITSHRRSLGGAVFYVLLGLACLALGANFTVASASRIGLRIGLSEAVVGMTIVAVGTSLPELITCLIASVKKQDDLSIGNLVGSNIFNTLLVLGAAGFTRPLAISPQLAVRDYWIMMAISILFAMFAISRRQINRIAGAALFLVYISYIAFLAIGN